MVEETNLPPKDQIKNAPSDIVKPPSIHTVDPTTTTKPRIAIIYVDHIEQKLYLQHFFHRFNQGQIQDTDLDPEIKRVVKNLLISPGDQKPLCDEIKRIAKSGEDARIVKTEDKNKGDDDIIFDGFKSRTLDPVVTLLQQTLKDGNYDKATHYVDVAHACMEDLKHGDLKPSGFDGLTKVNSAIDDITGHPMLGRTSAAGATDEEIAQFGLAARAYSNQFHKAFIPPVTVATMSDLTGTGSIESRISKILSGPTTDETFEEQSPALQNTLIKVAKLESEDQAWENINLMSDVSREKLLFRLKRVTAAELPTKKRQEAYAQTMDASFRQDLACEMFQWLGPSPDMGDDTTASKESVLRDANKLIKNLTKLKSDPWNNFSLSEREAKLCTQIGEGLEKGGSSAHTLWKFYEGVIRMTTTPNQQMPGKTGIISISRTQSLEAMNAVINPKPDLADMAQPSEDSPDRRAAILEWNVLVFGLHGKVHNFMDELDGIDSEERKNISKMFNDTLRESTTFTTQTTQKIQQTAAILEPFTYPRGVQDIPLLLIGRDAVNCALKNKPGWGFLAKTIDIARPAAGFTSRIADSYQAKPEDALENVAVLVEPLKAQQQVSLSISQDAEFQEYAKGLRAGKIPGLDNGSLKRQANILEMTTLMVHDTIHNSAVAEKTRDLTAQNPGNLKGVHEYWRTHSVVPTTIRWDGTIMHAASMYEKTDDFTTDWYAKRYVENSDKLKLLDDLEFDSFGQRNLATDCIFAMSKSPEYFDLLADEKLLGGIKTNFKKNKFLVKDFFQALDSDKLNTSRCLAVILTAEKTDMGRLIGQVRNGHLKNLGEKELGEIDWETTTPSNLAQRLKNLSDKTAKARAAESEFKKALSRSKLGSNKEKYDALAKKIPEFRTSQFVGDFSKNVAGFPQDLVGTLLDVAKTCSASDSKTAIQLVTSKTLFQGIKQLEKTPYAQGQALSELSKKSNELTGKNLDQTITDILRSPQIQEPRAVEAVLDWTGFEADRQDPIQTVLDAPKKCQHVLLGLNPVLITPNLSTQVSQFMDDNPQLTEIASPPIYVEKDATGFKLLDAKEGLE